MGTEPTYEQLKQRIAILENETGLSAVFQNLPYGMMILSKHNILLDVNQSACRILGYHRDDLIRVDLINLIHPEDRDNIHTGLLPLTNESDPLVLECGVLKQDGSSFRAEISVNTLNNTDDRIVILRDVSQEKARYNALIESEKKYRSLFEKAGDAIFFISADEGDAGQILDTNKSAADMHGYTIDELLTMKIGELDTEESAKDVSKKINRMLRGEWINDELMHRRKDGSEFPVEISAGIISIGDKRYVLAFDRDITERKKSEKELKESEADKLELEARLHRTQKLQAIGTLAGGIAHDFNNILSGILGYGEIALQDVETDTPIKGYIEKIIQAGQRARDLIRQILAFSQQQDQEYKPVRVKFIAQEALKLTRASVPSSIDITSRLASNSDVLADPTHIHQIILNLVTNAAHAMRETGGVLSLTLDDFIIENDQASRYPDLEPGPYVRLRVQDTGYGISPDILDRIFEPFFTTKKTGEGSGMGLSVVHGLVKKQKGTILVESRLGQGAIFEVLLPVIVSETMPTMIPDHSAILGGKERILFVDDEHFQTETGKKLLERLGYHVVVTNSSPHALELFLSDPDAFDLVITDYTMPQMTGDALALSIHDLCPDIPIILCTGFSDQLTDEKINRSGIGTVIMKPFVFKDFAGVIRQTLDNR